MERVLSIAVIGAGSAGPAAATLLARQGHHVQLFDQAKKNLPVGAGFMLQPSGMEVLHQLECLEDVLNNTSTIHSLFCKNTQEKTLLDLNYKAVAPHLFGAGTLRSSFLNILLNTTEKTMYLFIGTAP